MTIAFGVACEDGALLVTDSLTQLVDQKTGWITVDLKSRKFGQIGDRIRYVISGAWPSTYEPGADLAAQAIEDVACEVLSELELLEQPAEAFRDGLRRPTDLMVAGMSHEGIPGVVLVGTSRPLKVRAAIGARPLVAGAMGDWADHRGVLYGATPPTLKDAIPFSLECCRRYIRESWRAFGCKRFEDFRAGEPGGHVPPSAPPFHLAFITADQITTLEVAE